jgi:hypothetical protein
MSNYPTSFPNYDQYSEYNLGGFNFGDPRVNILLNSFIGRDYMPRPESGQSQHEAFIQKERTRQINRLSSSQMMNNALFSTLGVTNNPTLGALSRMQSVTGPDSQFNKLLSPIIGGNPIAATMHMYSSMAGANVMGNYGGTASMSANQVSSTMKALTDRFYNVQSTEQVKAETKKNAQEFLSSFKDKPEILSSLGLTQAEQAAVNRGTFDVTDKSTSESIKKRYSDRLEKAGELRTALKAISEAPEKEKRGATDNLAAQLKQEFYTSREKDPAKKKEDQQKLDKQFKELYSGGIMGFGSKLDMDKVKEKIDQMPNKTKLEEFALQDFSSRYKGINFANTRGYKVEDFESAFAKASELRMISGEELDDAGKPIIDKRTGRVRKISSQQAMRNFMQGGNAGEFMDAAKSLFGNKAGGELMEDVNKLLGKDSVNLGSKGDASKVSSFLRDFKSTARVAGVSLNAMFSIIESTNNLMRQNPQLQGMSQSAVTAMTLKNVKSAAVMGMGMSAQEYRAAGGSQGIAAELQKEDINYAGSTQGAFSAIVLKLAKAQGGVQGEKYQKLLAMKKAGKFSEQNLNNGALEDVSRELGVAPAQLMAYLDPSNADLIKQARDDKDVGEAVLNDSAEERMTSVMENISFATEGKYKTKEDLANLYEKEYRSKGRKFSEMLFDLNISMSGNEGARQDVNANKTLIEKFVTDAYLEKTSPGAKENFDIAVKQNSRLQEEFSKRFAGRNADLPAQLYTSLAKGGLSEDTVRDVKGMFMVPTLDMTEEYIREKYKNDPEGMRKALEARSLSKQQNTAVGASVEKTLSIVSDTQKYSKDEAEVDAKLLGNKSFGKAIMDSLNLEKDRLMTEGYDPEKIKNMGGFKDEQDVLNTMERLKVRSEFYKGNTFYDTEEKRRKEFKLLQDKEKDIAQLAARKAEGEKLSPEEEQRLTAGMSESEKNTLADLRAAEKFGPEGLGAAFNLLTSGKIASMAGGIYGGFQEERKKTSQKRLREEALSEAANQITEGLKITDQDDAATRAEKQAAEDFITRNYREGGRKEGKLDIDKYLKDIEEKDSFNRDTPDSEGVYKANPFYAQKDTNMGGRLEALADRAKNLIDASANLDPRQQGTAPEQGGPPDMLSEMKKMFEQFFGGGGVAGITGQLENITKAITKFLNP